MPLRSAGPTETAAFLALIDQLDHEPGPFPSDTEIERRVAVMRADAQASRPADSAADSPAFRAFRKLALSRRIGRKQLLAAHALLCAGKHVGRFRRPGVCRIRCSRTGVVLYTAPEAQRVPSLIDDLLEFLDQAGSDQALPFVALLQLLRIHPFADGNGRLARTLFSALCWRRNQTHPAWLLALRRLYCFDAQAIRAGSIAVGERSDWSVFLGDCERALVIELANWQCVFTQPVQIRSPTGRQLAELWGEISQLDSLRRSAFQEP